jgi:hypothetical protein
MMGKVKGTAMETTATPDGASAGSSASVDTPFDQLDAIPQAEVTFGAGFTEPTKPYGNVKFYVQLKVQCAVGEQDDVFDFAAEWVDERLAKKMEEVKEAYPD